MDNCKVKSNMIWEVITEAEFTLPFITTDYYKPRKQNASFYIVPSSSIKKVTLKVLI